MELTNRCEVKFPLRFLFYILYLAFDEVASERRLEDWGVVVAGEFLIYNELSSLLPAESVTSSVGFLTTKVVGHHSHFPFFERRVNDRERSFSYFHRLGTKLKYVRETWYFVSGFFCAVVLVDVGVEGEGAVAGDCVLAILSDLH